MALTPAEIDALEPLPVPTAPARTSLSSAEIDALEPLPVDEMPRIEPPKDLSRVLSADIPIRLSRDFQPITKLPKPEKSEIDAVQVKLNELFKNFPREVEMVSPTDIGPLTPPVPRRFLLAGSEVKQRDRNARLHALATDYLNLADADEGALQGLVKAFSGEGGVAKAMPFIGGLASAKAKALRNEVLDAMSRGEPLSEMEQQVVRAMGLAQRRAAQSGGQVEKAFEIIGGSLPYAAEFAMTGGLYSGARQALGPVLGRVAGVATQTAAASIPRIQANYLDRMAKEWGVNPESLQPMLADVQADKNALEELGKAGLDSYIENLSERTGRFFPKEMLGKLFRVGAVSNWLRQKAGRTFSEAMDWVKTKAAFHGVVPEVFEEHVGEGLRILTGVNESNVYPLLEQGDVPGALQEFARRLPWEETPAMTLGFSLVPGATGAAGVAGAGIERAGRSLHERRERNAALAAIAEQVGTPEGRRRSRAPLTPEQIDAIPPVALPKKGETDADKIEIAVAEASREEAENLQTIRPRTGAAPVQPPAGAGEAKTLVEAAPVAGPALTPAAITAIKQEISQLSDADLAVGRKRQEQSFREAMTAGDHDTASAMATQGQWYREEMERREKPKETVTPADVIKTKGGEPDERKKEGQGGVQGPQVLTPPVAGAQPPAAPPAFKGVEVKATAAATPLPPLPDLPTWRGQDHTITRSGKDSYYVPPTGDRTLWPGVTSRRRVVDMQYLAEQLKRGQITPEEYDRQLEGIRTNPVYGKVQAQGKPAKPETEAVEKPEGAGKKPKETKAATDDNLKALTDEEFDAMLEEASQPGKAEAPKAAEKPQPTITPQGRSLRRRKPGKPTVKPSAAPAPKPAAHLTDAAKEMKAALDEAAAGLDKLFGGGAHTGSGVPSFDEKTYQAAKPHFDRAWALSKQAGNSIMEFLREIIARWGVGTKPYLKRWREELQKGESDERTLDQRGGGAEAGDVESAGGQGGLGGVPGGGRVGGQQSAAGEAMGTRRESAGAGAGSPAPGGTGAGSGAGGRREPSGGTRGPSDVQRPESAPVSTRNYVITDADELGRGSMAVKARANLTAIRLLKTLEREQRKATTEEQKVLVRYVGWGGLKGVFDDENKSFDRIRSDLKELLTEEEFAAARASIQDAHYTSQTVIQRGIYAAMTRFGFRGGKMVEGGVGIGHFIGLMPEMMRAATSYIGVERDPITARIAQQLYPEARILIQGFQEASLARETFDGSVGNPPFGKKSIFDPRFPEASRFTIHNFFIGKTLELLRPGGVAGFVVSRYFLDNADPSARQYIAQFGEFLGAIRLPNTAFSENANTSVVTDLVFFRRHAKDTKTDIAWTEVADHADPDSGKVWKMNRWLHEHPEMVLGEIAKATHALYSKGEMTVNPTGELGPQLDAAVERLPQKVYQPVDHETKQRLTMQVKVPEHVRVGSFFVQKGAVLRRLPDMDGQQQSERVEMKPDVLKRIKGLIPIRDAQNALIRAELDEASTGTQLADLRERLNQIYDRFVADFGFLNSSANRRAFYDDTDSMRVLALERDYNRGLGEAAAKKQGVEPVEPSAKKADIFTKRVNSPYQEVTRVETPQEALVVSLNQRGGVDLKYMTTLIDLPESELAAKLGDLIFPVPRGGYATRELYLSGNVRNKLREAEAAARDDAQFQRNVEALRQVIPKDIPASDIAVPIGAPWVAPQDVSEFARELLGVEPQMVLFRKADAGWSFDQRGYGIEGTQRWGTKRMPFPEIFRALLNGKLVVVWDTFRDDRGNEQRVVNEPETAAAESKASEIREKWVEWIWRDDERRERLQRVYNDTFNSFADYVADGSHLTLPGANTNIVLRPHQKNVAWRMITLGGHGLLVDQVVGSGKTYAGIAGMMESKRIGQTRKWLVAVPNHLTGQWADAFAALYPNANILAARPSDFTKQNRQKLFARILTGDFDAVVLGHSNLKKIGTNPEIERGILQEMLAEIVDTIKEMKDAEASAGRRRGSRQLAQMERTKDNLQAKLQRLADMKGRDVVATFEELGFDGLFVDEAHEFKNLFYTTQMQNVAGLGDASGSEKAFDLYLKTRFLRQRYGGRAPMIFATGTPISNSLVEMFTMQRYLQPDVLADMKLKTLDAWARVFADIRQVYEVDPTGTGYRMATRFANFQNVGDLTAIYKNMADVMLMSDLQEQEEVAGNRFPVPKVKWGKPVNYAVPRSPEQAAYFGIETQVLDTEGKPTFDTEGNPILAYPKGTILWRVDNMPDDPHEDNMLKLTNDARKAGLDMRLIDARAPDRPESKINLAVQRIAELYQEWNSRRGTQLVFCDLSVPGKAREAIAQTVFYRGEKGKIVKGRGRPVKLTDALEWSEWFVTKEGEVYKVVERHTGIVLAEDVTRKGVVEQARGHAGPEAWAQAEKQYAKLGELTETEVSEWLEAQADAGAGQEGDLALSMDELLAAQSDFSVYDDMKAKLIAAGIPANQIAFIHDYDTPEQKHKLFKQMNEGEVRILFGSTAKMGAGMNVQRRLIALHHMDAPWRPSDLEQREGRAIRQGNEFYLKWMFPEWDGLSADFGKPRYEKPTDYETDPDAFSVEINRYATKLTYDTRMWQIIEHKAAGIEAFRRADRSTRTMEDVAGEAANAADMKAAASGDPLIQQEIELRNARRKLEMLKSAFNRNQIELRNRAAYLGNYEQRHKTDVDIQQERIATRDAGTKRDADGKLVFGFTLSDGGVTDEKGTALEAAASLIRQGKQGYFGVYRGFKLAVSKYRYNIQGEIGVQFNTFTNDKDPLAGPIVTNYGPDDSLTGVGFFQRLDNWMSNFEEHIAAAGRKRDADRAAYNETQREIEKPFSKEELLRQVVADHERVRSELMNKKKRTPVGPTTTLELESGMVAGTAQSQPDHRFDALLNQPQPAEAVLAALEEHARSAFDLAVIARLKQLGLKTTVRLSPRPADRPNVSGTYDGDGDTIDLYQGATDQLHTLLHELVHAATVHAIDSNSEFRAELETLLAEAARLVQPGVYGLKNVKELVAEAFSNPGFQQQLSDTKTGERSLWERFLDWLRRFLGLAEDQKPLLERLMRLTAAEMQARPAEAAPTEPVALETPAPAEREAVVEEAAREKWIPTQVMGETDYVRGRERITPESTAESLIHARNIFNESGLTVVQDMNVGGWRIEDAGYDQSAEGRKLAELLKREISTKNQPGKGGDLLASLLNSIVLNFKAGTMRFDQPTREALYELAQSDRSQRGLALGALAGFREDVTFVGQNVDVVLHRVYADAFGGGELTVLLERVIQNFRSYFTDEEIAAALKDKEGAEAMIQKIIALNRRDEGGRVYRRVQGLLKPKAEKKLATLEADARVEEAVREILQQAAAQGIEPVPSPNKPLSAIRRLLLMVSDKNAAQIDKLVAAAVADAERNAGLAAMRKRMTSDEEREELENRIAEGEEPTPEDIEEGLDLPQFAHWRAIRGNLLDYSPTTVKLVRDVIKGDFRGTAFGRKRAAVADTRMDLNQLATAPEGEVKRQLEAYFENVEKNVQLANASGETLARVSQMVRDEVRRQLEAARKRVRDPLFAAPKPAGEQRTPEEVAAQKINAGLFADERLDVEGMVERVAGKSAIARLTPNVTELIQQVFATPFYRQADLRRNFASELIRRFGVGEEQAEAAARVFEQAFGSRFKLAREKAAKQAIESLKPRLPILMTLKKPVWRRIEQAVNSGVFDTGTVLKAIARESGWLIPNDKLIADLKRWAGEEQAMRELTPAEVSRIGPDPARLEKARAEKEAATLERRIALKKRIEVEWSKLTRPTGAPWSLPFWSNPMVRKNSAAFANELASANLLLKLSFAPRQLASVLTQGMIHTPSRAIASAILVNRAADGNLAALWPEIGVALRDSYRARFASLQSALYATRAAFLGRGEARNVDRLMSSIAAIERIARSADEAEARGQHAKAVALRLFSLIRLGYRVAQALDNIHGLPAEYQEMILQVERGMREQGKSRAEIERAKDLVIGGMHADWMRAKEQARMWLESTGQPPSPAEVDESAWNLVKRWQYDRIAELNLPAADYEEQNRLLRSTIGWNERETKGLGGQVGGLVSGLGRLGEAAGVPLALGRFGNAIALSINRQLAFTPFYFLADVGQGESGWYKTETDRVQRKVEAAIGTTIGLSVLLMAAAGLIFVRTRWPRDKEERDLWEAQGRRPGTVEIPLGDGTFMPISLNTGPFQVVTPYLAAGGAIHDLLEDRAKAQARLEAEAARKGVAAGTIKPLALADLMGVAGAAAWGTVMGGRTAAGLMSSISDYGLPNPVKFTASQVSPYVPTLPALQEVMRMAGVTVDTRFAGFWDFMLPLPTSDARKVNLLGDPVGTPDDVQRVLQTLTGGTYPGPVDPQSVESLKAYQTLFASGYRPPSIDAGRGYQFPDGFRPMKADELQTYTVNRGRFFAEELAGVPNDDANQARAAYQRANTRALEALGVVVPRPERQTPATAPARGQGGAIKGLSGGNVSLPRLPSVRVSGIRRPSGPSLRLRRPRLFRQKNFAKPRSLRSLRLRRPRLRLRRR